MDAKGWYDQPDDEDIYRPVNPQFDLTKWNDYLHYHMAPETIREIMDQGDEEQAIIQAIPRATTTYTLKENSTALNNNLLITYVGISAKRGNSLFAQCSGASPANVNLDDCSIKGIQLIALPSCKKEHMPALILSSKVGGDVLMWIKRWFYTPGPMKPAPNSRFNIPQAYLQHVQQCLDNNQGPEPYITGARHLPLGPDTMKLNGSTETQYLSWKRLYFESAAMVVPPTIKFALANFFKKEIEDIYQDCNSYAFEETNTPHDKPCPVGVRPADKYTSPFSYELLRHCYMRALMDDEPYMRAKGQIRYTDGYEPRLEYRLALFQSGVAGGLLHDDDVSPSPVPCHFASGCGKDLVLVRGMLPNGHSAVVLAFSPGADANNVGVRALYKQVLQDLFEWQHMLLQANNGLRAILGYRLGANPKAV
ncbi:hypothetical protein PG996_000010 [Apiospora saccharicola]|uniref:Uncharacterized protein n=1 Tax=Apiospora saccharicola TaxID=335842 RepID=A0ABR1WGD1_9PEZI